MAKQVTDIRDFLAKAKRKDAKSIKVKRNGTVTKFKIRTARYLYTLIVADKEKADKISSSLPVGLEKIDI